MRTQPSRRARLRAATPLRVLVLACWAAVALQTRLSGDQQLAGVGIKPLLCLVTGLAAVVAVVGALRWAGPQRLAWLLLAAAISAYAVGYLILFYDPRNHAQGPWGMSLSDSISLLLYPLGYTGLSVLALTRHRQRDRAVLLEGAVIACGAATIAVVVVSRLYPSLLNGPLLNVVYDVAYAVGGFTLLTGTVTGLAVSGWRIDRAWMWLIAGFGLMTLGDAAYGLASAAHDFHFGTWSEICYTAGPVGVALAASERPRQALRRPADVRPTVAVPSLATLIAIGTLVAGHFTPIPTLAVLLAAAGGVLAVARTGLFLQQGRLLAQSRELARTDDLTSLPNRRALIEALELALRTGEPHSLLLLDLDGFKDVNDSFGHSAGDQLLARVADRLREVAWPSTVCRLGGDEFAILHAGTAHSVDALATAVCAAIEKPFLIQDANLVVGVSVGIGPLPASAVEQHPTGEALRRADVALYRAKATRSGVEHWLPALDEGLQERVRLVTELRAAIQAGDQIVAHFQPQADAGDGTVMGFEALVRWRHPRRGLLAPGDFLDAAETAGLLPSITQIMLEQALSALRPDHAGDRSLTVAVNIGAGDLLDDELPDKVHRILLRHGLRPERLVIEVTESVVLSDPDRMIAVLSRLRALGVRTALDDYGTGFASLSYLRALPLDELKIDRSLAADIETDPSSALIVNSTIALAHGLGLRVVVEGVEQQSAASLLATMGCDVIQGWLVGRPEAAESLAASARPARLPRAGAGVSSLPVARTQSPAVGGSSLAAGE